MEIHLVNIIRMGAEEITQHNECTTKKNVC